MCISYRKVLAMQHEKIPLTNNPLLTFHENLELLEFELLRPNPIDWKINFENTANINFSSYDIYRNIPVDAYISHPFCGRLSH